MQNKKIKKNLWNFYYYQKIYLFISIYLFNYSMFVFNFRIFIFKFFYLFGFGYFSCIWWSSLIIFVLDFYWKVVFRLELDSGSKPRRFRAQARAWARPVKLDELQAWRKIFDFVLEIFIFLLGEIKKLLDLK